ncbi:MULTISPECIES: hypothetical protein [unclassified Mycobacterium]|uniref:DUF6955 family protein n=1 Tax=unclassified Mycobacterium TaxID=2642494 RepID=UPI0007FFFE29|nr:MULTISPECIES: hypothetical protein [unclassified Mycobacterium]OBG68177.1 hypothetical protein A5704_08405 [Mycobacterium sp. E735]OBG68758.1 hypothetical protein A5703_10305 [Mycobacterium sp. E188]OBG74152.1 hypothetical protein A5701_22230 [Mycobacterium sp. E3305]OBG91449.1 hypothetical protein A9X05_11490 [Mycobacterium sp. E3298]OBH25192.1 hypothetical protein A9X03_13230 [Mycobacterium sp. E1715]
MSGDVKKIKVNVWINEERLEALAKAGMADSAKEAFAGMKLLEIYTTEEQKDVVLQRFPGSKYDSATTKSIELLPKKVKDRLLELSIALHSTGPDVVDRFLAESQP